MDESRSPVGTRLRSERLARHLNRQQLAVLAGISLKYIQLIEEGKRSPSIATLEKLGAGLGIPAWTLLMPGLGELKFSEDEEAILRRLDAALEESEAPPAGSVPRSTALYRFYDEQDIPLYIGISFRMVSRQRDHRAMAPWMEFAARSAISRYPSRREAARSETRAILAERPLFNVHYNNTIEARMRLLEYLVEHERADLIPLIRWPGAMRQVRKAAGLPEIPVA